MRADVDARLEALAGEHALDADAVDVLRRVLAFQGEDEHASTTVRAAEAAVDRHVADSLAALALPEVRAARRIADLGSGAGWPGIALAVALPAARVALVESASRRCRYLERVVETAGIRNAEVVHARAEAWPEGIGAHDLVTARALAALAVLCEYAAPLLSEGGVLVAWKGAVDPDEARRAARAAVELGLEPLDVVDVRPYSGAGPASLHRFRKAGPTPERYPRRPGRALKRPLGG
jgi:16S rRNA (guanine527-N7)-methyltransferase